MSARIQIDGAQKVERLMANYPKEMTSLIKKAMRRAAKPHLAKVENSAPAQWRSELIIKAQVKEKRGQIMLAAGIFGVPRDDNSIPAYYKYLWKNYGTYASRDPQHQFKTPLKKSSTSRNGQQPEHMFETAVGDAEMRIAEDVATTIEKSVEKFEKELNR